MTKPSDSEPDPTQAIPAPGTDDTQLLPSSEAIDSAAAGTAGPDATEVLASTDPTQATAATGEVADTSIEDLSVGRGGAADDPFWSAPDAAAPVGVAAAGAESAVPVMAGAAAAAAGPSAKGPGVWRRFTQAWRHGWSTTLGKVAIIGACALAVVALVGAIGLAAFAGRLHEGGRGPWAGVCAEQSQKHRARANCARGDEGNRQFGQGEGQGQRGRGQGQGQGPGQTWGENEGPNAGSNGRGNGMGPGMGNGTGNGMAPGMGQGSDLGQGALRGMLGGALHGEVVIGGATPQTVLFQVGEVTEYTAGTSIAVKSSDGFTATYAVTAETKAPTTGVGTGASVRVVALKDGAKATRIQVVSAASSAAPTN